MARIRWKHDRIMLMCPKCKAKFNYDQEKCLFCEHELVWIQTAYRIIKGLNDKDFRLWNKK
jgi:hypothetical protein